MYLLVLAHPGCPGQSLESHKMVVVVVVVVVSVMRQTDVTYNCAVYNCGSGHKRLHLTGIHQVYS